MPCWHNLFLEDKDEDKEDMEEDKKEMDATTVFRGSYNPNLPPKCDQPNHPFKRDKSKMHTTSRNVKLQLTGQVSVPCHLPFNIL